MNRREVALGLFAGPGGWETGLRAIGYGGRSTGIEISLAACQTAEAAGHDRIYGDVTTYPPSLFAGRVGLLTGSPPCIAFSSGGQKGGRQVVGVLAEAMERAAAGHEAVDWAITEARTALLEHCRRAKPAQPVEQAEAWSDQQARLAALIVEPARWIREVKPRQIALEQVSSALPLWRHLGELLRDAGYYAWWGIQNAEEHGVPQARERAILLASTEGPVRPPEPTHSRYTKHPEEDLFSKPQPVSMAEALGWGEDECVGFPRRADSLTENAVLHMNGIAYRSRDLRTATAPAQAVTEKIRSWKRYRPGVDPKRVTVAEAGRLQSFPGDYPWHGTPTQQFRQVGDAVPPQLAAALLGQILPVTAASPRPWTGEGAAA